MQILVTGGAGFIGSNLVRMALADRLPGLEGASVTVLDALTYSGNPQNLAAVAEHPHYAFVHGDIRDTGLLDRVLPGVDAIVHVAAESHVDRAVRDASVFVETNVVGSQRLLDAALRHDVRRVLHVSTDEVYGSIDAGAWAEDAPLTPGSPAAASKAGSDILARSYHRFHGLDVRITRHSSAYGPHQAPEQRVARSITALLDDEPMPAGGDQVRDWVHVDDHCRGIALALTAGRPGEAYNIGGGDALTHSRLGELLVAAAGREPGAVQAAPERPGRELPGFEGRRAVDAGKARAELGWTPEVPIETGLAETVRWYDEHRSWWTPLKERAAL